MSEIPEDIMKAAEAVTKTMPQAFGWKKITVEVAKAILAEHRKGEKLADQMYLTGVHDAYALAKRIGYQDFADRLLSETNDKAKRSGLPQLEPV
jgi:hypothetical protein